MPYEDTLAARFAANNSRQPSGCLLWTGSTDDCGYGMLRVDRRRVRRAHIVAWFLATGAWPTRCVLHTCDTPGCVEHAHHFEGTRAENNADCDGKGRHIALSGEQAGNANLTNAQAAEIRRRLSAVPRGLGVQLAREYGVSQTQISRIKHGKTYRLTETCSQ